MSERLEKFVFRRIGESLARPAIEEIRSTRTQLRLRAGSPFESREAALGFVD
jgi:hypothetical protein